MDSRGTYTTGRRIYRGGLSIGLAGVLFAMWLGAARWFASPPLPTARAQGIELITHTLVSDFTLPCVSRENISVGNQEGGELHLTASVEDDFDGTEVDSTRWITNISNPEAGPWQNMIVANGLITLDGVYLRSVLTMTQLPRFFEARARLMQIPNTPGSVDLGFYREIGPLYNPSTMTSSIRLFVLGNSDPNNLIVRVRDDGGPMVDYDIDDPDKTQFHIFRIEWEPNATRYFIDGEPQQEVLSSTTVVTSWVFLYHQTPSSYGSTPTDIDWVRAGQYATNGSFTSCPQDAGRKVRWTTLSWDADIPDGTVLAFRVRTSMDGNAWSDWSDPLPLSPDNIPATIAFARYLQYRVEMSTTNVMRSPQVRAIAIAWVDLADLAVSKSASTDPVLAGNALTYTIRVTNNGSLAAPNVRVTDTLPAGVTLVSASASQGFCSGAICDLGTLGVGNTALITLQVRVNPDTPDGTLTNAVTASTSSPDDPANNQATVTTQVQTQADLALSLEAAPDPVIAGALLTYTAVLRNEGPSEARGVGVTFTLPSALSPLGLSASQGTCIGSRCDLGVLGAGATARITLTASVRPDADPGPLTTQAKAASATSDPNPSNNQITVTTQVQTQADLVLSVEDAPDPVIAGALLTYTAVLRNEGPSEARGVGVTFTLPSALSPLGLSASQGTCIGSRCDLGVLGAGATARITLTASVRPDADPGLLTTQAEAASATSDPNPSNNQATVTTQVQTQADLALSLEATPDPVIAGTLLTYTAVLRNEGPSEARGVGVTFTLPSALFPLGLSASQGTCIGSRCDLGVLGAGATARITLTASVRPDANPGLLTTQAEAASATSDPNPSNNQATVTTQVQTQADLTLSLEAAPDPVVAGRSLVYQLAAVNQGPSDAQAVRIALTLPVDVELEEFFPLTCSTPMPHLIQCDVGSLDAQAAFTLAVTVTVRADLDRGFLLIAQAEGSSITDDPNLSNNRDAVSTEVALEADLRAALDGEPMTVFVGDVVTYTLTVTNSGPSKAPGVTAWLDLPTGLRVEEAQASLGACSTDTQCELGDLNPGDTTTVRWRIRVAQWPGTPITIRAQVSAQDAADPNLADNTAEVITAVRFRLFLPLIAR